MSWSLGEIEALSRKAAYGRGHSWGVAEEAGWAVRCLAQAGLPGPEALAAVLSGSKQICPIMVGCAVSDRGDLQLPLSLEPVNQPILVLPFVAACVRAGKSVSARIGDVMAELAPGVIVLDGPAPSVGGVDLLHFEAPRSAPKLIRRVERISAEALATLERFARSTYAPATEASRELGAGAGLTDTD